VRALMHTPLMQKLLCVMTWHSSPR
jgi:hypothetical protein